MVRFVNPIRERGPRPVHQAVVTVWDTTQTDSDQKSTFSVRGLAVCPSEGKGPMSNPNQTQSTTSQSGPRVARSKRAGRSKPGDGPLFEPNAAGIDIGAREIFVAVPPDRDTEPVRKCETFTEDLRQMADWLVSCGVTTAAMESTGVYWIPVYDVLEQHGIKPCLVNPRNMKNAKAGKTHRDFHECQWIQHLHSMGLLHSAFRPEGEVCAVRSLMRHRNWTWWRWPASLCSTCTRALTQMNVQIQHVISDITGQTGF